jgi:ABC-type branched-subunit amino acid transport system permease subunit
LLVFVVAAAASGGAGALCSVSFLGILTKNFSILFGFRDVTHQLQDVKCFIVCSFEI